MSETATPTAPAAPAAPAFIPPSGAEAPSHPPVNRADGLTISEAARLLNAQRRQSQAATSGQQASIQGPGEARTQPGLQQGDAQQAGAVPRETADPLDSMARALGLNHDGTPAAAPAESTPPAPATDAIEVDGQRLTAEQVRRAISFARDYTYKTQQLQQERAALEQQQQALAQVIPHITPELQRLTQQLQAQPPPLPDRALAQADPTAYVQQLAEWNAWNAEAQRAQQIQQLQQQAQGRAFAEQVDRANAVLAEQIPQWSDPNTRLEWQKNIAEWAEKKGGFTRNELSQLADPRHLQLMMKSMLWDRMVDGSKTSAPVQQAPPRGAAVAPAPARAVAEAETAFQARPDWRNGAALLAARRANTR
jgi:hypothetical protein